MTADRPEPPGLSENEAAARLAREGFNELPRPDHRTLARIVRDVGREPMFQLLVAAGAIYLFLGDVGEALMLLAFVIVTMAIAIVQEQRTERVLDALRDLSSPRALVIRDGVRRRIAGREVARGDAVVLAEGDRVPADGVLAAATHLRIDESLLTGESVPVRKAAGAVDAPAQQPGGDDLPFVFSGSMVTAGHGIAIVTATGAASRIGRIGRVLGGIAPARTPLNVEIRRLVRVFALLGTAVSLIVVVLHGLARGAWFDGILAGITVAMSMLPQEFPLILTVFMAMGAWRISRERVLTRRPAAIETLGAATVLCTDKTGTLTLNRMAVAALVATDGGENAPASWSGGAALHGRLATLARFAMLASRRDPFDPMEKAFHAFGRQFDLAAAPRGEHWRFVHEYGLAADLLAMARVWRTGDGGLRVAAKGAPEAIATLCRLDPARRAAFIRAADRLAGQGMRVLGVAEGRLDGDRWPANLRAMAFAPLGLAALADPLRPAVPAAVAECREAGIRVVMITGDYPATARAIAADAGIDADGALVTGDELAAMSDAELRTRVAGAAIFARIMPEQKLRVVEALKANGEIVAMTGDGVNDAPSLKEAHIGIAMGGRGTDVAREAAALVLLDDDFGSIVDAVRLGRRIYDNLRKALGFTVAVHVPIAGLSLLPLLVGLPVIFAPVHIAFLELVIDPACSIVFEAEPEEDDVMRRPPRDPARPLFSLPVIGWNLLQGTCVLVAVAGLYVALLQAGNGAAEARAAAFIALVVSNFSLILANRAFRAPLAAALSRPNGALWRMAAATAALLALVFAVPALRALFGFAPPGAVGLAGAVAVSVVVLGLLEALKRLPIAPGGVSHGRDAHAAYRP